MNSSKNKKYKVVWQNKSTNEHDQIDIIFEFLLKPIFKNPQQYKSEKIGNINKLIRTTDSID